MLGLPPHLPDAAVGIAPVGNRVLHLLDHDRPDALGQVVARLGVQVDRVQDRAPDVVLVLVVGAVAHPDRPRALVTRQVGELLLLQLGLAVDAVHDLELALLGLGHVGYEVEEVVGLPVEAQGVEAPERERGVPDPGVAVVPVALPARRLRQRRGGRGDHGAGGRVGEALERQRAALEEGAPRDGRGTRRGRASAASGARSTPAARRPRRSSAAGGARTTTAPRTACRPPSSSCARSRAGPRRRCSCPWSAAAPRRSPRRPRRWPSPRGSRVPCTPSWRTGARSRRPARSPG